ncbi:MAG: ATP-dependent Clp protease proteolytic subunit [Clostridia bacterium]|nr:ATP-dependent Clp protease proteolytic subunit [Clostridia bacterium]
MNNSQKNENIEDTGSITTKKDGISIETITVIGQVEGHYLLPENQKSTKYEHLIPLIVDAEQNEDIKGVLIILNTVGGDVEAGLALAEMIAGMGKPTVSLVVGGGHSIGVPLAVSADRSFIVPSATMTVHPVRITGLVVGAPQTYTYFKKMQERITDFIVSHSSCTKDKFEALLAQNNDMATDQGTILDGKDAVDIGLIDEVGNLKDALKCLNEMIKSHT